MQVFIRSTNSFCLDVNENDAVLTLKEKIFDHQWISVDIQKLIYCGKILKDSYKLKHYKITDLCTIDLKTIVQPKYTQIIIDFDKSPELIYCIDINKRDKAKIVLQINEKAMFDVIFSMLKLDDIKNAIRIKNKSNNIITQNTRIYETNQDLFHLELIYTELTFDQKIRLIHQISNGISINHITSHQTMLDHADEIPNMCWFSEIATVEAQLKKQRCFDQFDDVIKLNKQCQNVNKLIVSTKADIKQFLFIASLKGLKYMDASADYFAEQIKTDFQAKKQQIKVAEMKIANIDWKLNEIRTSWKTVREHVEESICNQTCKLEQRVFKWSNHQLTDWLYYICYQSPTGRYSFAVQPWKRLNNCEFDRLEQQLSNINLTGNKIHEITDSLLCFVGLTSNYNRQHILDAIKTLLDANGYYIKKQHISNLCFGCASNEINTVNLPCGHMVYCKQCSYKSSSHNKKCAICREFIFKWITIYQSGNNYNNDENKINTKEMINTVIKYCDTVQNDNYLWDDLKKDILNKNNYEIKTEITDSFLDIVGIKNAKERQLILHKINGKGKSNNIQYCCVCTVNPVNTIIDPCGHMVYCKECSLKSLKSTNKCAICRKDIRSIPMVYPSGLE